MAKLMCAVTCCDVCCVLQVTATVLITCWRLQLRLQSL